MFDNGGKFLAGRLTQLNAKAFASVDAEHAAQLNHHESFRSNPNVYRVRGPAEGFSRGDGPFPETMMASPL